MSRKRSLSAEENILWERLSKTLDRHPGHEKNMIQEKILESFSMDQIEVNTKTENIRDMAKQHHRAILPKRVLPSKMRIPVHTTKLRPRQNLSNRSLDKKVLKDLKTGKRHIEAVLDLHNMNVSQAHRAVTDFICRSQQFYARRCVLIITGKGNYYNRTQGRCESESGILKREVPIWLATTPLCEYITGVSTAHPRHGGQGALYIYLYKSDIV